MPFSLSHGCAAYHDVSKPVRCLYIQFLFHKAGHCKLACYVQSFCIKLSTVTTGFFLHFRYRKQQSFGMISGWFDYTEPSLTTFLQGKPQSLSLGSSRITAIDSQIASINASTLACTSSITTANHASRWGALGQRSVVQYDVHAPSAALALMWTEKRRNASLWYAASTSSTHVSSHVSTTCVFT